jgi:hypothetical protein
MSRKVKKDKITVPKFDLHLQQRARLERVDQAKPSEKKKMRMEIGDMVNVMRS